MSDIRARAKQAAAKREQEAKQIKKIEPKPAPQPKEPVKLRPPWQTFSYIVVISFVLVIGVVAILKIQVDRAMEVAFDGLTVEQVIASSSLSVYCESIEAPQPDCDAWVDRVIRERWGGVAFCEENVDWIRETRQYTYCLLLHGVSAVPGMATIDEVDLNSWSDADWRVVAQLNEYCDASRDKDYCDAWSPLQYWVHRTNLWSCGQTAQLNKARFAQCVNGLGIPL